MKEKKQIEINYQGSGVHTLNTSGYILLTIGVVAILFAIVGLIIYLSSQDSSYSKDGALLGLSVFFNLMPVAIIAIAGGAICLGLKSIAKTALYQRALLEEECDFK